VFCEEFEAGRLPLGRIESPGPPIEIEPLPTMLRDPSAEPEPYV
jgi:hypothetical protein